MKTIVVDRERLVDALKSCAGHVRYKLGAKPALGMTPGAFRESDCSGIVRWLIHYVTSSRVLPPDGSWNQDAWCRSQGFKPTDYANCAFHDDRIRIAFIRAYRGKVGHVWLVVNGQTVESYGGKGFGRRPWNNPTLKSKVTSCYVLTDPM